VSRSIVVAMRMASGGAATEAPGYLVRARAMCVRGEEMDGRLVAWSAAGFAMGWDVAYLEKAARYAASIREEIHPSVRPWAAAMAEGDLEALSPDGEGILAWGSALLWAAALAESAGPGQVLVHDELHARHGDDLNVVEALAAGDSSQASRYWQLDLDRPWLSGRAEEEVSARRSQPVPARLVDAIAELRRARARVGGRSPSAQCQAALALAMMLANAGRPEGRCSTRSMRWRGLERQTTRRRRVRVWRFSRSSMQERDCPMKRPPCAKGWQVNRRPRRVGDPLRHRGPEGTR
jgi:hypothetical protein